MPFRVHPISPSLLLSLFCSLAHGDLYRWVDDEGNVHYTDKIPPSQIEKGHTEISEEGVRIRVIPAAKTREEIAREKEIERLRAQQEKLLEQQRSADRVLLRTFRSEDDVIIARDGKLSSIDTMIKVSRNNIRRQQEWLAGLRAEAADLERAGKPVPKHLIDAIDKAERSIRDGYSTIVDRETQKHEIRERFSQDLARFRQLRNLPEPESSGRERYTRPTIQNIVRCAEPGECDRLWERAAAYVRENTTTAVQTNGANVLITAPPATDQDVSLILSRIHDKEGQGASLFLDLQCARSVQGTKTCQGETAKGIIERFRPAVLGEQTAGP
jgi:hypothetical protein